jgi:CheY-like chemotaxis protein
VTATSDRVTVLSPRNPKTVDASTTNNEASALVLHVDDDDGIRGIVAKFLTRAGHEVKAAADNFHALALLRELTFDVIITDLVRPGGLGEDFLRIIREQAIAPGARCVVLTGQTDDQLELRCWRLGIAEYIRKPVAPARLLTVVDALVGGNVDPDARMIELGAEGADLDYKEALDLETSIGRASFARDVLAMANGGGGTIIVGVAEGAPGEFAAVGVPDEQLARYETTRLNDSVRKYLGSGVGMSSRFVRRRGKAFVFVSVNDVVDTLALALTYHERAPLYTGRIYLRGEDARSAEVTDPLEIRRLIDRLVEKRLKHRREADRL